MIWAHYREPTLDEMLSDSIVQAVMEADHVDPHTVRATLRQITATGAHSHSPVPMSQHPRPRDSGTAAQDLCAGVA